MVCTSTTYADTHLTPVVSGMGNRFSTIAQYHTLILGHGVLAAITFLFIVPFAVLIARFYTRQPGSAVRYHFYLNILAVGLTTVVFVLGFFAVGPPRNLTNPHHGIGVAIYVLILLQAVGGRLVKKLAGRRSFRMHIHRWFGRAIAILGIVQVPLGLTLYGSPKHLFILFAVWMAFLLFLFFILDYRDHGRRDWTRGGHGGVGPESSRVSDAKSHGGALKWLGPLAAGAGAMALLRGRRKNRDAERGLSRSPTPTGRSHRDPEVISSRRASDSYYDEKQPERRRASGGSGFMGKLFGAGAGLGAAALVGKMMNRRDDRHGDEYSAVATDTPSRVRKHPPPRSEFTESEYTELTEDVRRHPSRHGRQSSILPAPRPGAAGARPPRPMTPPRRSHAGTSRLDSTVDASDYSSYVSPSRRTPEPRKSGGGVGKGLLAGLGLGFLAKMGKDRRDKREEERLRDEEDRRRDEEEDRRAGRRVSRYTGDGYPSPSRRESRRRPHRPRPPPSGVTMTETSILSGESSIEPRGNTPYDPAPPGTRPPPAAIPVPPPAPPTASGPGAAAPPVPIPVPIPVPPAGTNSGHPSRYDVTEPVSMPPMPADPHGLLHHDSASEAAYDSPSGQQHRRRREGEAAAAAAAASASLLAAQEDEERRRRGERPSTSGLGQEHTPPANPPVSVRVRVHDDRDRNITLRMLTDEEARREQQRRSRRADSVSSISGGAGGGGAGGGGGGEDTTPTNSRRYRRDSSRGSRSQSRRRAEAAAEQRVERDDESSLVPPLSPPNPAFARRTGGGGGPGNKDSAYYSGQLGQPGPSGAVPAAGATVSSLGGSPGPAGTGLGSGLGPAPPGPAGFASPGGSHATFTSGPMSNADTAAADRRRRRRLERRDGSRQATTVDFS